MEQHSLLSSKHDRESRARAQPMLVAGLCRGVHGKFSLAYSYFSQYKASWLFYHNLSPRDDHNRELVHKELRGFGNKNLVLMRGTR